MTLRKGHVILGYMHVTSHVIRQALSHHMTKHMTGHMIRQALSCHVILHVILGKNHLTSQGIGQEYSHVPFQGLDMRHVC